MNNYSMSEGLREDIADIKKGVRDITIILKGRKEADQPEGLIYDVHRNTEFREFFVKVFWIIFTANAGLLLFGLSVIIHYLQKGGT